MTTQPDQDEYADAIHGSRRHRIRTHAGWLTFVAAVFLLVFILNVIAGRAL